MYLLTGRQKQRRLRRLTQLRDKAYWILMTCSLLSPLTTKSWHLGGRTDDRNNNKSIALACELWQVEVGHLEYRRQPLGAARWCDDVITGSVRRAAADSRPRSHIPRTFCPSVVLLLVFIDLFLKPVASFWSSRPRSHRHRGTVDRMCSVRHSRDVMCRLSETRQPTSTARQQTQQQNRGSQSSDVTVGQWWRRRVSPGSTNETFDD